jgi:hypothetical protein
MTGNRNETMVKPRRDETYLPDAPQLHSVPMCFSIREFWQSAWLKPQLSRRHVLPHVLSLLPALS